MSDELTERIDAMCKRLEVLEGKPDVREVAVRSNSTDSIHNNVVNDNLPDSFYYLLMGTSPVAVYLCRMEYDHSDSFVVVNTIWYSIVIIISVLVIKSMIFDKNMKLLELIDIHRSFSILLMFSVLIAAMYYRASTYEITASLLEVICNVAYCLLCLLHAFIVLVIFLVESADKDSENKEIKGASMVAAFVTYTAVVLYRAMNYDMVDLAVLTVTTMYAGLGILVSVVTFVVIHSCISQYSSNWDSSISSFYKKLSTGLAFTAAIRVVAHRASKYNHGEYAVISCTVLYSLLSVIVVLLVLVAPYAHTHSKIMSTNNKVE